ncbi:MAG: PRC-barrel domain-containing protein [Pseudomonadota bacterium]
MISALSLGVVTANAEEPETYDNRLLLSFAPQKDTKEDRFEQFDMHSDYEDAHELNDAWLGMPVRSTDGSIIGYVEDAFLDSDGYLEELHVALNQSSIIIKVDAQKVDYTEVAVLVDIPLRAIAELKTESRIQPIQ